MTGQEIRKAVKAYWLGYRKYRINDLVFTSYTTANRLCDALIEKDAPNIGFYGYHKKRGWEGFFIKAIPENAPAFTANARE